MESQDPITLKEGGLAAFRLGDLEQALVDFETAYALFMAKNDKIEAGEMLNNIGVIQRFMRQPDAAEETFGRAKALFIEEGDIGREAQVYGNLADLYDSRRERERAFGYYLEAAERLEQVDDFDKLAITYRAMSRMRMRQFKFREWIKFYSLYLEVKPNPTPFDRFTMWFFAFWSQRARRRGAA